MNILIVEDETTIREVEAAYLKAAGFDIVQAENGRDALDLFNKHKFDLVLLDINIPEIDGITVCKDIRSHSNVPIVMVTARTQEIDELVGLECGADDYIKKPFTPSILVARVKNLLKRISGGALSNEYIKIDPERMSVTVKEQKVELTTKEFNILYMMMKNPGRVYTRDEIIDKAYTDGIESEVLDRTVDAHIKNIRKKLALDKTFPEFIVTVIGKGYKFNDEI
jgi:two-component system response regulator BaeR